MGSPFSTACSAALCKNVLARWSRWGRVCSRWPATSTAGASSDASAFAASRWRRSRSAGTIPSLIAEATSGWAKRSPSAPKMPAAVSDSRAVTRSSSSIPATAATACCGASSPITDCAAATARSRGVSSESNRRTVSTVSALTGAASWVQSLTAQGPCSATCRPSSESSHGFPSTDRWQSRHTAIDVSGAWRRIRVAAPRGDNGCGCSTKDERAPPSRLSRSVAARGSPERTATTMKTGRSSIRRARYDSTSSD